MARGDEEDQGTPGSATSETEWESTMLLRLERHKIAISGGPWSPKSLMDMEPFDTHTRNMSLVHKT